MAEGFLKSFDNTLEISSAGIEANGYSVVAANPSDASLTLNVTATCLGAAASP